MKRMHSLAHRVLFGVIVASLCPSGYCAGPTLSDFSTGGHTVYHLRPATVEYGGARCLISAAYDGTVLCHTPGGKLRWKAETGENFPFDLCVADIDGDGLDEVLVAPGDGVLYAIGSDVFYTQRRAHQEVPRGESWTMGTRVGIAKSSDQGRSWNYVGTAQGMSRGLKEETFWAPHVFEEKGMYHMFVTFIPKVAKKPGKGGPEIFHYTSRDLVTWGFSDAADVRSDDIIDPGVVKRRDDCWLMVFRDCRQQNRTAKVISPDLKNWKRLDDLTGNCHHEAPVVLFWKNKFWLFIDEWKGIGVYESDDSIKYTQNNLILDKAGKRADDKYFGSHPGVALAGDRAFIFYHCHAGKTIGIQPSALDQKSLEFKRSSLQVAELEMNDGKIACDRDKYSSKQP